jgi:His/Glu/Gln/Arg/opine family amino acid ABC transporter permease subunit
MLEILQRYHDAYLGGLIVTLQLALVIWGGGLLLGTLIGLARVSLPDFLQRILRYTAFFFSAIPVIVALFWFHYPIQQMIGVVVNPFLTAAAVLTLYNIIVVADLVGGAVERFPRQYVDAALLCGLHGLTLLRVIVVPLVVRQILPALLISQVYALQTTLFSSLISVDEIFRTAQRINAIEYRPIEIFTSLAFFYVIASFPVFLIAEKLRRDLKHNLSEK